MKKQRLKFEEMQRWPGWLRGVVLVSLAGSLALMVYEVTTLTALDAGFWWRALLLVFALACHWVFYCLHLRTEVSDESVRIRYHPVRRRTIRLEDIAACESRTYDAVSEYGGWGVRGKRVDRAYTFQGNQGVQLELKNGQRVLIGSQRPDELVEAVQDGMTLSEGSEAGSTEE